MTRSSELDELWKRVTMRTSSWLYVRGHRSFVRFKSSAKFLLQVEVSSFVS